VCVCVCYFDTDIFAVKIFILLDAFQRDFLRKSNVTNFVTEFDLFDLFIVLEN